MRDRHRDGGILNVGITNVDDPNIAEIVVVPNG